jgi:hypothetical protein
VDDIRRGSRLRRGENVHTNGGSKIPGEDHREEWSSVLENSTSWTVEVAEREEEDDGFECSSRNELVLERPCGRRSELISSELEVGFQPTADAHSSDHLNSFRRRTNSPSSS